MHTLQSPKHLAVYAAQWVLLLFAKNITTKTTLQEFTSLLCQAAFCYVSAPNRRGIKRCFYLTSVCLTSVCQSRTSVVTREQKTEIVTEAAHVTRDSDTTFKVKRSKGQGHQAVLVGCSSHYIIYMHDTIIYATAQSQPLPVDHEYSRRWAPQA